MYNPLIEFSTYVVSRSCFLCFLVALKHSGPNGAPNPSLTRLSKSQIGQQIAFEHRAQPDERRHKGIAFKWG